MSAPGDRTVLVLGGAGTVGSGTVKVLLDRGFRVVVISRDAARLEKLKNFVPAATRSRLSTLVGDVVKPTDKTQELRSFVHASLCFVNICYTELSSGSEEGAEAAKNAVLQAVGKVTDVVSSLGFSWWQGGPPHTQTLEELNRVLKTLVISTFTSWKAFFPLVKDDDKGSYTFITGGAGERLLMPGTGFLTLGAAGALAFCQVVREEYPDIPCKLNEVKLNMGVATPDRIAPGFVNHLDVGEAIATVLEKNSISHHVFCVNTPADLKTLIVEGKV
ncbi:uncharacterized protein si:dkey-238o13.4 isoform X1 [Stegostoma tigrinum]|uniref:uncharacterized protein si:dkey-238o13.4 isoform X1 n=1 Tax=Stegostoma tigrinum TaxID=3053191 RepID=UPI00202AD91F|nr:uncharacterized protein si:dkey-238o13.4 isoform X1 [Stegostoma tigrinum]